MRLHRLEIAAWGPFPDEVVVDFDALGAEGLYLIQGPTGAGKTSLLDAICYALYGAVPGIRATSRRLSSDHAQPGTTPRVLVELTASGRRLRVRRTPPYTRPKRSGVGDREMPATVAVDEWRTGRWLNTSTGAREADDVIADVVGLGRDQFATVVMLPQGEFAAFLRAAPDQRRELLKQLFDVTRFDDVERWLTDRRKVLGAEVAVLRADLAAQLQRVGDAVATAPGLEDAIVPSLEQPDLHDVSAAVHELVAHIAAVAAQAGAAVAEAEATRRDADDRWVRAGALVERQDRWRVATDEAIALEAGRDRQEWLAARLSVADRALQCADVLHNQERAHQDFADAAVEVAERAAAVGLPAEVGPTELEAVRAALATSGSALERLDRAQVAYHRASRTLQTHELDRQTRRGELVAISERLTTAQTARARLGAARSQTGAIAAGVDALSTGLGDVTHTLDVLARYEAAVAEAELLRPAVLGAVAAENDAHTAFNVIRSRQLDAAAADLASHLRPGGQCPVCGSSSHPEPASPADRVDPSRVEQAERAWEHTRQEAGAARSAAAECDGRRATLLHSLGGSVPDRDVLVGRRDELAALLEAALAARARLDAHDVAAAALDEQIESDCARLAQVRDRAERADALASAAQADAEAARLEAESASAAHEGCPCFAAASQMPTRDSGVPQDLSADHAHAQQAVLALAESIAARARSAAARSSAMARCAARLAELGFGSEAQARSSALAPDEHLDLTRELRDLEARTVSVAQALADPELQAAAAAPPPDLDSVRAERDVAQRLTQRAAIENSQVDGALRVVAERAAAIDALMCTLAPLAEEHLTVTGLADACSGLGPENTRRMPLSAYVLAGRLERVVELANERLARMGDGRYLLRHTDEHARRGARSGLGLLVVDSWTGRSRDPASLSGGESFMASLALALGLADAVRTENGGVDLQTLFVDEGFGSLDEDSLDQVIDVLDGLREGGRAVGIVSHVPELRQRIPAQVVVTKTETGSTVSVRGVDPAAGAA